MIPATLWIVLFFIAAVIFVFMLFFADSGERAVVQGMLIGSVVAVMTALLLLLQWARQPFHDGVGGLQPVAMERSLRMIDEALGAVGVQGAAAVRRRSEGRCRRDDRRRGPQLDRARGDRAARSRHRRDGLERLPVDPLERRAGKAGARANALRIDSAKAAGLANTQTEVDVATFTQWVNAYAQQQTQLTDFYFKRFRQEFRPAVNAWIATRPLKNPNAPSDAVRHAAVQARGACGVRAARARKRRSSPPRRGATSSARRTTCSVSCCSPPRCSSQA